MTPILGFSLMLIFSIFMGLSSSSLFFFWVSLEINMIAVLPIFVSSGSFFSSDITMKYFVSQSIASIFFLIGLIFSHLFSSFWVKHLVSASIIFKLGVPPFHSWLLSVVMIAPLKIMFIILFAQKFIPLHILSKLYPSTEFSCLAVLLSFLFIFFFLKNLTSLRSVLMLSAWSNSTWMLVAATCSGAWLIFLLSYGAFFWVVLVSLNMTNAQKISSVLSFGPREKILYALNFLNLAGLPPFSGFFMKLFLLKSLIGTIPLLMILSLMILSLVVLFAYTMTTFYWLASVNPLQIAVINETPKSYLTLSGLSLLSFPLIALVSW